MNSEWFEKVVKEQIKTCEDVLIGKAKEYATDDDRLHNFKNAAGMMSCDPKEALAGMMAKHTISIYDMCRNGKDYPIELWNEKITDHINYLLLLKAVVEEEKTLGVLYAANRIYETMTNKHEEIKDNTPNIDDVIEALTQCTSLTDRCHNCPYDGKTIEGEVCATTVKKDALDLLKIYKDTIGLTSKT